MQIYGKVSLFLSIMKRVLLLIVIVLLSSSCVRLSSFRLDGEPTVRVKGIVASGVYFVMDGSVENSGRRVTIKGFDLDIVDKDGDVIGSLSCDREVIIERGDNPDLELLFKASISRGIFGTVFRSMMQTGELYLNGTVSVKAGISKRVKIDMVPLKKFGKLLEEISFKL